MVCSQSLRDGSRIVMKHDFIVTRIYIQYISCNAVPLYTQPQCGRNAVLLYTQPQCDRNAVLFVIHSTSMCSHCYMYLLKSAAEWS